MDVIHSGAAAHGENVLSLSPPAIPPSGVTLSQLSPRLSHLHYKSYLQHAVLGPA